MRLDAHRHPGFMMSRPHPSASRFVLFALLSTVFACKDNAGEPGTDDSTPPPGGPMWYIDYDGDGFGASGPYDLQAVEAPDGYVDNADDCNDQQATINPLADEICDGVDNDCSGAVDDDPIDGAVWYRDVDGDGYGDPNSAFRACEQPADGVSNALDTDDADGLVPGVMQGDWPQLGNGPGHSGYFPGRIGSARLEEDWSYPVEGTLNPVVVVGQTVYLSFGNYFGPGSVVALNASDGSERWSYALPDDAFSVNPPSWYADSIYLQRGDGGSDTHLWCFDAENGQVRWRSAHGAQWENYLAPAVAEGHVWVNGGTYGGLYGFDAETGRQLFFNSSLEQYDEWTPAYDDGMVYTFVEGNFRAHDADSGQVQWSIDLGWSWGGWSASTAPLVVDGVGYVASSLGLFAIDLENGELAWGIPGVYDEIPAVANGYIYAFTEGAIERYALEDGTYDAIYIPLQGDLQLQPIVTDDALIVANGRGVEVFDLSSGERIDEVEGGGRVSLGDGRLFVAGQAGLRVFRWPIAGE